MSRGPSGGSAAPTGACCCRIGVPVAPAPAARNFSAIRGAIDRGEIPDQIRNEVLVDGRPDGGVWMLRQYDHSLNYFSDLFPMDDELWVLMTTLTSGPSAVVLVFGEDGIRRRRIEINGAAGANTLAVDPLKQRLVLSTSHDAQVVMAEVP